MNNEESLNKTISINITKELDEKLIKFSKAMNLSKSQLCQQVLENQLEQYYQVWNMLRNPKQLDELISAIGKLGKDTSQLESIKKGIQENPQLVKEADNLFKSTK